MLAIRSEGWYRLLRYVPAAQRAHTALASASATAAARVAAAIRNTERAVHCANEQMLMLQPETRARFWLKKQRVIPAPFFLLLLLLAFAGFEISYQIFPFKFESMLF